VLSRPIKVLERGDLISVVLAPLFIFLRCTRRMRADSVQLSHYDVTTRSFKVTSRSLCWTLLKLWFHVQLNSVVV